eukprot:Rmarinus@m.21885
MSARRTCMNAPTLPLVLTLKVAMIAPAMMGTRAMASIALTPTSVLMAATTALFTRLALTSKDPSSANATRASRVMDTPVTTSTSALTRPPVLPTRRAITWPPTTFVSVTLVTAGTATIAALMLTNAPTPPRNMAARTLLCA